MIRCRRFFLKSGRLPHFLTQPYLTTTQRLTSNFDIPTPGANDEIVVAMSSGVDSSVAAAMLAKTHANVRGVYMANWSQTAKCTEQDWNDVKKVCDHIGIPCERVNFERDYWTKVFEPMVDGYREGKTPNPDVGCNRHVKFGRMIEHLKEQFAALDANRKWWLATGHYARVVRDKETLKYRLLRGVSSAKDQSYYLSSINPEVLQHVLMPIGNFEKLRIREFAEDWGLHVASKPDSQGLCFVSQEHTRFSDFLDEYLEPKAGNIITADGKVWGQHSGVWHATIGQRASVSMPQGDPEFQGAWYVAEKRLETNELVIVRGGDNNALFSQRVEVADWHWLAEKPSPGTGSLLLQYRSLQTPLTVESSEWPASNMARITLLKPARAIASGQVAVLYNNDLVLGSGTIVKTAALL